MSPIAGTAHISSPEALKQRLLNAQSIATIRASAAGIQVLRVFESPAISDAARAKTRAQPGPSHVAAVAQSDTAGGSTFAMRRMSTAGATEYFGKLAGVKMTHIPYKGGGPAKLSSPPRVPSFGLVWLFDHALHSSQHAENSAAPRAAFTRSQAKPLGGRFAR